MLQRLFLTTAIAALALTPALAQDSTTGGSTGTQQPPVQTPSAPEPQAQDVTPPSTTTTQDQTAPEPSSAPAQPPADVATEAPATPPPADAIITAETATDMRADKLIGTAVYNTEGEEVGTVKDIVFDKDGQIVGVVLKVGGLLGIGGKDVGIKWNEVQISPTEELMTISFKKEQLEVAPDFKTQDMMKSESTEALPPAAPSSSSTTTQ
jgi:sporulation protein YlmC with PRC-barrel domain